MNHVRDRLPPARTFYQGEGFRLARVNSKGWAMAQGQPPCHVSTSGKSLSINVNHGGFVCFGCGKKGSMIDFVMLSYRLSYKEAKVKLGLDDGKPYKAPPRRGPLERWLVMDFIIDGAKHQAAVKDEPKNELQLDRRFYAEAADRLLEIRNGAAEEFEGEEETQWAILAAAWELIQMEAAENG
jgi:hypothetical protein